MFFHWLDAHTLQLNLRVSPGSSADRVGGLVTLDDGKSYLALRVRAVAEDGTANSAAIKLLAQDWGFADCRINGAH